MKLNKLALTLILSFTALKAQASFEENARRYLSAQEILQSLQVFFDLDDECKKVTPTNSSMLGVNSPVTGNPIAPSPTQSTVQLIAGCVSNSVARFIGGSYPAAFEKVKVLLGPEVMAALTASIPGAPQVTPESAYNHRMVSGWTALPSDIRSKLVANMVLVMLGSDDVINDFGLIDPQVLRTKLEGYASDKPDLSVFAMIKFLSVNLSVRDEFLSY